MRISQDILSRIRNRWRELGFGERREYLEEEARRLGVSLATLYRRIKEIEGLRERERSVEIREEVRDAVYRVYAMIEESVHAGFGKALRAEDAIRILEAKGLIPEGLLSPGRFWRYVDKMGLREGERRYYRTFRARRSNAMWQVDVSGLKVMKVVRGDRVRVKGVYEGYYRGKAGGKIDKVWVFLVVDDYSGAIVGDLFISAGEDWRSVVEGLCYAFERKDGAIYGVPGVIYTDQAGWTKMIEVRSGFAKLGIKNIRHEPGRSHAKGKVERRFRTIQQRFENVLGFIGGERSFAEVRGMFRAWVVEYNGDKMERWVKGLEGLRMPPGNVRELFYKRDVREVRRMRIYYGGREYWAPAHLKNGDEIEVFELDGEVMGYDARLDKVYRLMEVEVNREVDIRPSKWREEYLEKRASFEDIRLDTEEILRMWRKGGGRIVMPPRGEVVKVEDIVEKERYLSGEGLREYFAGFFRGGLAAIPDDLWGGVKEFLDGERTEEEVRLYVEKIKKELESRGLQRRRINDVW